MRGAVPWIKGIGRSFPMPSRVRLVPHEARATFEDYPSTGHRVEFDRGAVRGLDTGGALVVEDSGCRRRSRRGVLLLRAEAWLLALLQVHRDRGGDPRAAREPQRRVRRDAARASADRTH